LGSSNGTSSSQSSRRYSSEQALEDDLGVRLLITQPIGFHSPGRDRCLLRFAQEISVIAAKAEQELAAADGPVSRTLELGVSSTIAQYVLPQLVAPFLAKKFGWTRWSPRTCRTPRAGGNCATFRRERAVGWLLPSRSVEQPCPTRAGLKGFDDAHLLASTPKKKPGPTGRAKSLYELQHFHPELPCK